MKKLIYLLAFSISLTSCGALDEYIQRTASETKEEYKKEVTKDSTAVLKKDTKEVNQLTASIKKSSSISLKTADSIANKRINEALRNFRYTDRSGKNSVSAQYDTKTMQIIFDAYVAGTKTQLKESNTELTTETSNSEKESKTLEQRFEEYIYKKYTRVPWWVWAAAYFFFFDAKVTAVLSNIFPVLKTSNSILGLLNLFRQKR